MSDHVQLPASVPGLDTHLGFEIVAVEPDRLELTWTVGPELLQPFGIQHGGVYCAAVESAASIAASNWFAQRDPSGSVVGVNNSTDFYRAVREGVLTAVATPIHRGRSQQVWEVRITDAADRLVARGQVRLQNLSSTPPPTG